MNGPKSYGTSFKWNLNKGKQVLTCIVSGQQTSSNYTIFLLYGPLVAALCWVI